MWGSQVLAAWHGSRSQAAGSSWEDLKGAGGGPGPGAEAAMAVVAVVAVVGSQTGAVGAWRLEVRGAAAAGAEHKLKGKRPGQVV